jgi:histone acetyltransferase 1
VVFFVLVPAQLYNALYDYALRLPSCLELTIEDPSEEFEDLRDRNDLKRLIQGENAIADCEEIKRGAPVDKIWAEKVRKEGKYAKVSFSDQSD